LSLVSPSSLPSRSVVSRRHPERSEGPLYLSLLLPLHSTQFWCAKYVYAQ
jgi:hypothetical protein